jgi:hypothetical protein
MARKLSFPSACGIWIARIVAIVSFPTKIVLVNKRAALAILPAIAVAELPRYDHRAGGLNRVICMEPNQFPAAVVFFPEISASAFI